MGAPPKRKLFKAAETPAQASADTGLTTAEALALAAQGLGNRMPKRGEGSVAAILWRNVFTLFNLLNLVLAGLLLAVGSYRNMLFLGVVVSNTLIGLVKELRAKRLHDRLQLLCEGKVRTLRDGEVVRLSPSMLVLHDVVLLGRGEQIPADARVLEGNAEADEAQLTGESEPVPKGPGDTLQSGSHITEGQVTARLTAVGAESYAGALQLAARKVQQPRSELMESMRALIRWVSVGIIPLGTLLYWKQVSLLGLSVHEGVTRIVAAVLGMIPEGLILLTSMALTLGAVRLGKQKALVNSLYGIESLARTDVICMDKTGTLTSGAMTVSQVLPLDGASLEQVRACMEALVGAMLEQNPTQAALERAFGTEARAQAMAMVPFASQRKWAAVQFAQESLGTLALGAPEQLLSLEDARREQAGDLAAQGYRVLVLAQSSSSLQEKELPGDLRPLAFLCLADLLRPHVEETVRYFGQQGVELKVISGDHPLTVASAARAAGLPGAERVIDLSACTLPIDYGALCQEYTIFGRVSPQDKRELIVALKAHGHGVAMIGDGVNDVPALKAADCSIAMAGGSDAASRVAHITLLDDSFSAMPQIVLEGRRVINNIARVASMFLFKNLFSLLLTLALLVLPFAYPFVPIQMTLISAVTIGIPAFVLALEPSKGRIQGQFLRGVILRAIPGGLVVCLFVLGLCALGGSLGIAGPKLNTFCALATGITGLWMLFFICLPLHGLRLALIVAMTGLFGINCYCFPSLFYFVPLTAQDAGPLLGLLVLSPACLTAGMWLTGRILRGQEKKEPKEAGISAER